MRETYGDIWRFYGPRSWVVIPTNVGWRRRDGANVMGAGLAKQAAQRFPDLPLLYGGMCQLYGRKTPVLAVPEARLIMFPVKPLNQEAPHLSWQSEASLEMIRRSAFELCEMEPALDGDIIALPMVGCGNGRLDTTNVYPVLWRELKLDRFVLVKGAYGAAWRTGHSGLKDAPTTIFPSAVRPA